MVTVVVRQRGQHARRDDVSARTEDGGEGHPPRRQLHSIKGDTVEVALDGTDPPWLEATLARCAEILQLMDGWNSYGARPVDPTAVATALRLLTVVMAPETPAPLLIPTSKGSISLEWHMPGIDLEVRIVEPDQLDVYLDDQVSGQEWEALLSADLTPLAAILSELAARALSADPPAD